jgi:hypothetical protein
MSDKSWMKYILTFGKYKGDSLYIVYLNDYPYISEYLDQQVLDEDLRKAVNAAIEHKNTVDPYSNHTYTSKSNWKTRNGH